MKQSRNNIKISIVCALILCWTSSSIAKRRVQSRRKIQPIAIKKMTPAEEIAAAREEARTQELKSQRKKQCYDLMMIIDSDNSEKADRVGYSPGALEGGFFSSVRQQTFPIMVSSNIVYNACVRKSIPFILNSINLTNNDWYCYDHPQADIILFVPKSYVALFKNNSTKNITDQMKECGFNIGHLITINELSTRALTTYIEKKMNNNSLEKMPLTQAIESMFAIPNQPNLPTWNIYLIGHGYTNYSIAGLPLNDFMQLLGTFQKINCSWLHYASCYSGGYNQNLVKDQLSQLKVNFIVSTQGINEDTTFGTQIIPPPWESDSLTSFFNATEAFFGNPKEFAQKKIKQISWQKDPIATIVSTVIDKELLDFTQPFVYIPAVGVFNALNVDASVKIITEATVKAYEFENKTIDFTNLFIETVIVYPNYIGVPVKIKAHTAIVSPTRPNSRLVPAIESKNTGVDLHIFEEIIYNDTLPSIISNFASFNCKTDLTIFVIKKLQYKDHEKSITIENMIIDTILKNNNYNVSAYFNLNGKSYWVHASFESQECDREMSKKIFQIFAQLPAQEISLIKLENSTGDVLYDYMPLELRDYLKSKNLLSPVDANRTLANVVGILESTIDTTTHVQERGSLQRILLKKQQEISQQQGALAKKQQTWTDYFLSKIQQSYRATKNFTQSLGGKIQRTLGRHKQR